MVKHRQRGGLIFMGYAIERGGDESRQLFVQYPPQIDMKSRKGSDGLLGDIMCAAVQVFNGETRYGDTVREGHVQRMLEDPCAKQGAVDLCVMRGMIHNLAYSQLENIVGQHSDVAEEE